MGSNPIGVAKIYMKITWGLKEANKHNKDCIVQPNFQFIEVEGGWRCIFCGLFIQGGMAEMDNCISLEN